MGRANGEVVVTPLSLAGLDSSPHAGSEREAALDGASFELPLNFGYGGGLDF